MQSLKKIMADLGFNKDAPLDSQKAFFKHLVKAAEQSTDQRPEIPTKVQETVPVSGKKQDDHQQLEFDFSEDTNKKQVS